MLRLYSDLYTVRAPREDLLMTEIPGGEVEGYDPYPENNPFPTEPGEAPEAAGPVPFDDESEE
jgi:hypothetical protein